MLLERRIPPTLLKNETTGSDSNSVVIVERKEGALIRWKATTRTEERKHGMHETRKEGPSFPFHRTRFLRGNIGVRTRGAALHAGPFICGGINLR